jgi:hypothetical protein
MEVQLNVTSPRAERLIYDCIHRARGSDIFQALWEQEFTPGERHALGGKRSQIAHAKHGVSGAWKLLRGHEGARAAVEIMFALGGLDQPLYRWLLSELGEVESPDTEVDRAVATGALVLIEGQSDAYWDGSKIPCEWYRFPQLWGFLVSAAKAAKRREVIDRFSLGKRESAEKLKHRKYHLTRLDGFPPSLAKLLRSAGKGTYRLNLKPDQIRVFEQVGADECRELIRSA